MSLVDNLGIDKMLVIKFTPVSVLLILSFEIPLKMLFFLINERLFWLNSDGIKKIVEQESYGKYYERKKHNIR